MKNKLTFTTIGLALLIGACGGNNNETKEVKNENPPVENTAEEEAEDYSKGIGKFKDVTLSPQLDVQMAELGKEVYVLKCEACHRLSGPKLVGPSWDGVTERRDPAWILNFITNVDEMLAKDPEAMAQFEECLIRMPNQNLTDEDAFAVLEYMRQNDGVK